MSSTMPVREGEDRDCEAGLSICFPQQQGLQVKRVRSVTTSVLPQKHGQGKQQQRQWQVDRWKGLLPRLVDLVGSHLHTPLLSRGERGDAREEVRRQARHGPAEPKQHPPEAHLSELRGSVSAREVAERVSGASQRLPGAGLCY